MPDHPIIEKIKNLISDNPGLTSKIFALVVFAAGLFLIIGAIKDWDWIYKPDESYHNWYSTGQVSRYLGRGTARVLGFIAGLFIMFVGGVWSYSVLIKK